MPEPFDTPQAIAPAGGGAQALAATDTQALRGAPAPTPVVPAGRRGPGRPAGRAAAPRGLWSDAWRDLRRNPVFLVSALVIVFLVLIAIWPELITDGNPYRGDLSKAQDGPAPGHPFGYDLQGRDVYTRTVYGARASIAVGICATAGAALLGSVLGGLAGYYGGWWDALLSRIADVFFGIPIL
ncbi:ABC transporter permease, partial [Streptomyces milbemycinicus]